jgi:hypothetical protein
MFLLERIILGYNRLIPSPLYQRGAGKDEKYSLFVGTIFVRHGYIKHIIYDLLGIVHKNILDIF